MLYIQESLGPDEDLIHVAHFHWMHTVQAVMNIIWGAVASILMIVGGTWISIKLGWLPQGIGYFEAAPYLHPGVRIAAFLFFIMGLMGFARMMIEKATTEIAISNIRVIYKRGLVARHVGEISIDRIEGVNVLQTILGRIFGYGRLGVRGMGVGEVVLPTIEKPIEFRRCIEQARALYRGDKAGQI